jgi:uncharacterized protein (DUF2236 family)
MEYFVNNNSIVRQIWGKGDTILFIFAGAAAEFALNKAVDWLYFTGRLPADPLGRLFSTVSYARVIIFSEQEAAHKAIDSIAAIHAAVEGKRGARIPDWAYRDVLFMLIDYSIRSYELLERKLDKGEKQEVFEVFHRVGTRMGLTGLPEDFDTWQTMRESHIECDLAYSPYTTDLFKQYCKHLGEFRYQILLESQALVVPPSVSQMLRLRSLSLMKPIIVLYKIARMLKLDNALKSMILPAKYKKEIAALDQV